MKDAATLLALADTVEALTGPDREVDARVRYAIEGREYPEGEAFTLVEPTEDHPAFKHGTRAGLLQQAAKDGSPRYTASLDAAMALVPEGSGVRLLRYWVAHADGPVWMASVTSPTKRPGVIVGIDENECWDAATPALALTAAALRAHAAIAGGE